MKKLIAISVVFALVVGTAFAVDLGGEVIGTVELLKGDNSEKGDDDPQVFSNAQLQRVRLQGEASNEEGTFGGWVRVEAGGIGRGVSWDDGGNGYTAVSPFMWGYAWWKPIDQFKIWIGGNGGDGFFGKEGQTAWMFYQRATDPGVTFQGQNAWGGGYTGLQTRDAFYGGDGNNSLYMTISPVDIANINIELPFFHGGRSWGEWESDGETGKIFPGLVGQVDLNFDFGNIALTYQGSGDDNDNGKLYAYFNLASIENLGVDVGIGFPLPVTFQTDGKADDPKHTKLKNIAAGLGVQYGAGDFGIKARAILGFAGNEKTGDADPVKDPFEFFFDILPYFGINDNLKVFLSAGIGMQTHEDWDDPNLGFHVNPYVWVGQEWGPSFWAGFKLYADKQGAADAGITWSVPIAIGVSF
jgi:hypothetical protein